MRKIGVFGPHGSGNRLMARILHENGLDVEVRSFPATQIPAVDFVVRMRRDVACTALSQMKEGMVRTYMEGLRSVAEANAQLDQGLDWVGIKTAPVPSVEVNYSDLVSITADTLTSLGEALGVPGLEWYGRIIDGDRQYRPILNGGVKVP